MGNHCLTDQCRFIVLRVLVSIPCTGFPPNKQPRQNTVLWQDFAIRIAIMKVIVGTLYSHWRTGAIPLISAPSIRRLPRPVITTFIYSPDWHTVPISTCRIRSRFLAEIIMENNRRTHIVWTSNIFSR